MSKSTLELRGRVVQTGTDRGIPDLRVVVVDQESQIPTMLFRAITDEVGEYCIELSREEAASLFSPGRGQVWDAATRLYISVYNGDALLLTTSDELRMHHIARGAFPTVLEVSVSGTADIQFSVHGRVVHADGTGVLRADVRVERVEAASRMIIATGTTDPDGGFDLSYAGVDESTATLTNMALVVVADDGMSGDELARTPVIVDPEPRHRVDLLAAELADYTGQPEYTQVLAAFEPWVSANALPNLSSEDLELLVKRTGMPADQVAMAIQAQRIATARGIPAEASYALMRAGLPADVPGQLAQSQLVIRAALQKASDTHLVAPTLSNGNPFDIDVLMALYATEKTSALVSGTDSAVRDLVATSGLDTTVFLTRWSAHEGTAAALWDELRAGTEISAQDVDTLEFTVEAASVIDGHLPALSALQADRTAGTVSSLSDLAGWDAATWSAFVSTNGAPPTLPGDQQQREAAFAVDSRRRAQARFPSQMVARRFEASPSSAVPGVTEFFDANLTFEVGRTNVTRFFAENPTATPSGFAAAEMEESVKRVQRVFALTPEHERYEVSRVLLDEGVDSAARIVHMGRASFTARFSSLFSGSHATLSGESVAAHVYGKALEKHGFSLAMLAQYGASANSVGIPAVASYALDPNEGSGATSLADLFGSMDYCSCSHCSSQFGPAAYLVDLLAALDGAGALGVLNTRRPDIAGLDLSCANTNTPLPYIDLVNELLEQVSADPASPLQAGNTSWTAQELRLTPEPGPTVAVDPYAAPEAAAFPWTLGRSVRGSELREYMQALGFTRADAMELFSLAGSVEAVDSDTITAERLGVSARQFQLFAGNTFGEIPQIWGQSAGASDWTGPLALDVGRMLEVTGLSFEELGRALSMRRVRNWVTNAETLELRFGDPACDIGQAFVNGFDEAAATSLHRLIRASRATGLSLEEIDIVDQTFDGLNGTTMRAVVEIKALQALDAIEVDEACGLWAELDTHDYDGRPSLYTRLFANHEVLVSELGAFPLDTDLEETVHFPYLRAALRISDAELRALIQPLVAAAEAAPGSPALVVDASVVGFLFARTRLAQLLSLEIRALIIFLELSDVDPFAGPSETRAFIEQVARVRGHGLTAEDVDYLCRHRFSAEADRSIDVDRVLESLVEALAEVERAATVDGTPQEAVVAHAEALLQSSSVAREATGMLSAAVLSTSSEEEALWQLLVLVDNDPSGLAASLSSATPEARFAQLAPVLEEVRRARGYRESTIAVLAAALNLDGDLVQLLATDLVLSDPMSVPIPTSILDALADPQLVLTPVAISESHRTAVALMHKVANLLSTVGVARRDMTWLFSPGDGASPLALSELPLSEPPVSDAQSYFAGLEALIRWVAILDERVGSGAGLESLDELPVEMNWQAEDVTWARSEQWLDLAESDLRNVDVMWQLRRMAAAVRKTGVRASDLALWARTTPTEAHANAARNALQSSYDRTQWTAVIQPISDRLRAVRRDVLLDYIVERDGFGNRDALFAHYLIDAQMGACTLTSRIKLAISAVQLFFQRSIMELEPEVSLAPGIEREWEWRKNYRVWEANRKVFFYPENWATPELRTNKTHLFKQLEATIQREELTGPAAEKAVVDYVVGLHEVSQLIVLDIHRWIEPATGNLVESVVARARAAPSEFFYRARVAKGVWSPWEKIESGITGEHAIIKAVQGRVFVIWLDFLDGNQQKGEDDSSKKRQPILSWSERWQGEWTPKRTIPALPRGAKSDSNKRFMLWGGPSGDPLAVYVLFFSLHGGTIDRAWKASFDPVLDVMTNAGTAETTYHSKKSLEIQGAIRGQRYTYGRPPNDDGQSLSDVRLHHFADLNGEVQAFRVARISRKPPVSLNHQGGMPFAEPRNYVIDFSGGAIFGEAVSGASLQVGAVSQSSNDQAQLFNADLEILDEDEPSALESAAYQLSAPPLAGVYEFSTAQGLTGLAAASASLPASAQVPNGFRFESFSHPYTGMLLAQVAAGGATALFEPRNEELRRQLLEEEYLFHESDPPSELDEISYLATEHVLSPLPRRSFDFETGGAYSVYNWELFFHVPLYIANRFRLENRFADADRWYRFVFDPSRTAEDPGEGVERFWNVKPLFQESELGTLDLVQELFSNEGPDANSEAVQAFKKGIQAWLGNPFDPHAIAAVRAGTYRWVAVKGYLDNLIDWGDALFRRDTIESINEATQLYLLAAELLGQRPRSVQALDTVTQTYNDLDDPSFFGGYAELEGWDPLQGTDPSSPPGSSTFSNTFGYESPVPPFNPVPTSLAAPTAPLPPAAGGISSFAADLPAPLWWTFCLPPNPDLLAYWDRVGDRLFKIRNCQNIEGVERMLALFAPPIDPGLLVRATALGIDLSDAIDGTFAPTPNHRYRVLAARAVDLASDVRALGGALLTALEKRDGESLSRLRAVHEVSTLERARAVRSEAISEAGAQLEALEVSLGNSRERQRYFKHLVEKGLIQPEKDHVSGMASARRSHRTKRSVEMGALVVSLLPTVAVGTSNSVGFGSLQMSAYANFIAASYAGDAADSEMGAQAALVSAGHTRRFEDWKYQAASAEREAKQIERQIVAAKVRLAIAERELANHDHQTGQSKAMQLFYQDKFSSEELYDWMIGEISGLYFLSYKLALDMAKKAERAMQFELETDDGFIGPGYWDSLRKGLMAGERLHLDIKRMESAYLDKDKRELELTKRVSLRQVAPGALAELRESGTCEFEIPELLFDLDHGGHYLRRIRAVRVTIPAVAGPQTSIGATLTLLRDDLRTEPSGAESGIRTTFGGTKRVATSHAREDGGLFELNFRDERYLPFEGAGVASRWSLRLPTAVRQFDYDTISDVEIRIDYTARDGGSSFRQDVEQGLQGALSDALAVASENGIAMVLSAKKDFAVDWERFLRPAEGQTSTVMEVPITSDRFPYLLRSSALEVASVELLMVGEGYSAGDADATLSSPSGAELTMPFLAANGSLGGSFGTSPEEVGDQPWGLDLGSAISIDNADEVEDLWVIVRFNATLPSPA